MTTYVIRRILLMIPTLIGITVLVFAISRLAPGDPIAMQMGLDQGIQSGQNQAARQAQLELYGLDKPEPVQYFIWLKNIVQLNFGQSFKHHRPVIELIAERLPITLTLNLTAFTIIYLVALPLGTLSALRHNRFTDRAISVVLFILWSLPIMWVGQMLIGYFSNPDFFNWFPSSGINSNNSDKMPFLVWLKDRIWHLVLPVLCITFNGFTYLTKIVRASMLDNLRMDYVRTARAKGLAEKTVIFRHAFRNSIIPVITVLATLLPAMIAGSVIIEKLFSIPGMGLLAFEAITTRDYNVVMAVATISGVLNLAGLLLADICYAIADPRISYD
ncbi:ABC transporter permease [Sedimentisphaera salicampi]|uniref:ABC transporter permease n=1 Tax=Sedimentisphaera salicampi TaxID=1941349 RepID=UPI000B9A598F|nr:ABC transporter permease [Sedimentisphaera salicampi]OXU15622.1 Inner membrane ABC transporter permease protein YejB [Sedimentisphaera salicampi]